MAKRKNVLLILSDQQRMDTVGAYGMNDICKTPHIDQLAAEGMKFNNAYTPSAICAPARPGRIKEVIDIDIPYPRGQESKMLPRFTELKNYIWNMVYKEYLEVQK